MKKQTKLCASCDTLQEADFFCEIYSLEIPGDTCLNCCACAFGVMKPDIKLGICEPVVLPKKNTKNISEDLPF